MVLDALEDAGLTLSDVDGVCHAESAVALAEYLGLHPVFTESTMTGGSSYEVHVEHAAAAIAAGLCDVVVSVYAATPRSDRAAAPRARRDLAGPNPMAEWEMPYGLRTPMGPYALAAARHMHEFGTTSEQLAQIAVSTRQWAPLNPRARYRDPLTVDDVLASPLQVSPLHLLDCCLVTDGAGAFVMTSAERARYLRQAAGLRPRRGHLHGPHGDQPDARPDHDARAWCRAPRPSPWPAWRPPTSTSSWATTASPSPRSSTSRTSASARRARAVPSPPTATRPGRRPAGHEHQRRRAVLHPSGHVRHVPPHRSGAPAARRVRRAPGRGRPGGGRSRLGHVPLGHVDGRARHRGRRCERRRRACPEPASSPRSAPRAAPSGRRPARVGCWSSGARPATAASSTRGRSAPIAPRPARRSSGARPAGGPPSMPPRSSTGPRPPAPHSRVASPTVWPWSTWRRACA